MPVREILQLGNPVLWQRSRAVDDPTSPEILAIITDLADTLVEFRRLHGFGRGIASPQIGVLKRVIFIRMPDDSFLSPLINPQIAATDDRHFELWDACFSFPDLLVKVSRAVSVEVDYVDEKGISRRLTAEGDLAELLQHEIDHLDGVLAIDRAVSRHAFATRTEWQRNHSR